MDGNGEKHSGFHADGYFGCKIVSVGACVFGSLRITSSNLFFLSLLPSRTSF